eukprot:7060644-Pyramimonas_sp.AAC.1
MAIAAISLACGRRLACQVELVEEPHPGGAQQGRSHAQRLQLAGQQELLQQIAILVAAPLPYSG